MIKIIVYPLTSLLFINVSISQKSIDKKIINAKVNSNKKEQALTVKRIDFFNIKDLEKLWIESENIRKNAYEIEDLKNNEFASLGNNWYRINSRLYKLVNNEFQSFDFYHNYPFNNEGQLNRTVECNYQLNDSILVIRDYLTDYFYNIFTERFISTLIDKSGLLRLNLSDAGSAPSSESETFNGGIATPFNTLVKTDLVFNDISGFSNYNEYCSNLLQNNSLSILTKNSDNGSHVHIDNKFSRYIYIDGIYINRFDVNDNIPLSSYTLEPGQRSGNRLSAYTYNDSLSFTVVSVQEVMSWGDFDLNEKIDVDFSSLDRKANSTTKDVFLYFERKYNKRKLDTKNAIEVKNSTNTYNNLIGYNPYFILVYNYRKKKIIGVLDRKYLPFRDISKLSLDRENKILIAQTPDNYFTLFDIDKFEEIITLKGNFNSIDKNNKLIVNLDFTQNSTENKFRFKKLQYRINYSEINLNDIVRRNDFSFSKEIDDKPFNLNELSTKNDFRWIIDNKIKNVISYVSVAKKDSSFLPLAYKGNDLYSNDMIKQIYEDDLKSYYDYIGVNNDTVSVDFSYSSYDQDKKTLELISKEVDNKAYRTLGNLTFTYYGDYKNPYNVKLNLFGSIRDYKQIDFKKVTKPGNFISLILSPVELNEAYAVKDGIYNLQFKMKNKVRYESPSYTKIFLLKYKDVLSKKFADYYDVRDDLIDQSSRFFNIFYFVSNGIKQEL